MRYLLISALLFFLPASLAAQSIFGTVRGTVTDTSGAVVANATVKVTNQDQSASREVVTLVLRQTLRSAYRVHLC